MTYLFLFVLGTRRNIGALLGHVVEIEYSLGVLVDVLIPHPEEGALVDPLGDRGRGVGGRLDEGPSPLL